MKYDPLTLCSFCAVAACSFFGAIGVSAAIPASSELYPIADVRLSAGPFKDAAAVNRAYLLAHDPDRLLAPFLREAGLPAKATSYGNWENTGLDGHTAGHYLSGLASMVASGEDTPDGVFASRLDYMLDELERCQIAYGDGYIGGVPNSRALWDEVRAGVINANTFDLNGRWVPLYNIHKTYAGLRDAYLVAGRVKARDLLVNFGDWLLWLTENLSDAQVQTLLHSEHGGLNETMADIYAITGDSKYLTAAERLNHEWLLNPLLADQDQLTGHHANTQVPKVIGFERYAALAGDAAVHGAAEFFWQTVTQNRSVAFGGNSVNEHFNNPNDFSGMIEHREGPETCNTYNMLRLSEQLFAAEPKAEYADYYERALYNHILSAINTDTENPGYVYFTPLRPGHYRVYSQPGEGFWCCVGSGMENPGRYGQFVYAKAPEGVFVNLFLASEITDARYGLTLRQETLFPDESESRLVLDLESPVEFTLYLRHPAWVAEGAFTVRVNGQAIAANSLPSSYVEVTRLWNDGDVVDLSLPMETRVEPLPDGSDWAAIMHGPILLASPTGTDQMDGLYADDSRMGHIAWGPLKSIAESPALVADEEELPLYVERDAAAGPLRFRLKEVSYPGDSAGVPLMPFFRLHESRYQMYWEFVDPQGLAQRQETVAQAEQATLARDAATLDRVGIGEQQSEVEHNFVGTNSGTGIAQDRRWRDGAMVQYTLNTQGAARVDLVLTYWGGDDNRAFDIHVNDTFLTTESLNVERPWEFFERRYVIPQSILQAATDNLLTVRFDVVETTVGGLYGLSLMAPDAPLPSAVVYKFDETGGTVASDSSGNKWHANLINGASFAPSTTGNAVALDGANDHVDMPAGVVAGLTHFTISTWIRLEGAPAAWSRVFDFGTGQDNYMFLTPNAGTGLPRFAIRIPSTGEDWVDGDMALPVGEWAHLAVTLSGNTGILYLNGVEIGRNESIGLRPSSLGVTDQNYIGRSQFAVDPHLAAMVDDFRIYNPALGASVIRSMATIPSNPVVSSLTVGDSTMTLNWEPVEGITEYRIERSAAPDGAYTTLLSGVSAVTSFVDFELSDGTQYNYRVFAMNGAGPGDFSDTVSAMASPTISAEQARDSSIRSVADSMEVVVSDSVLGHRYQLVSRQFLDVGQWDPVGASQLGNGGELVFEVPGGTDQHFYRIVIDR